MRMFPVHSTASSTTDSQDWENSQVAGQCHCPISLGVAVNTLSRQSRRRSRGLSGGITGAFQIPRIRRGLLHRRVSSPGRHSISSVACEAGGLARTDRRRNGGSRCDWSSNLFDSAAGRGLSILHSRYFRGRGENCCWRKLNCQDLTRPHTHSGDQKRGEEATARTGGPTPCLRGLHRDPSPTGVVGLRTSGVSISSKEIPISRASRSCFSAVWITGIRGAMSERDNLTTG